ncbi:hypothetical protein TIFTF001_038713 [Ficus carica]|uniref:Uncharacterized protein n=1 Tax=Ficus carica TaxID=3494 RepID=A0AA88JF40_FICCA|nr:hypothetical protein TIFTF001_038713 [Ficus carica]
MLWLVNGKLWGMADVRLCAPLSGEPPDLEKCGIYRRQENSSKDRLNVVKESCIGNGCPER